MNLIQIVRNRKLSNTEATYGTISFNGVLVGFTVELSEEGSRKCIPEGHYQMYPHDTKKHPLTVAFHNPELGVWADVRMVPKGTTGRTDCLIHPANFVSELEGCIAPGSDYFFNTSNKPVGVKDSRVTMSKLQKLWGDRTNLEATILWV